MGRGSGQGKHDVDQTLALSAATYPQHGEKADHLTCLFGNKPAPAYPIIEKPGAAQIHLWPMPVT
jgi:hypothetical protein